MGGACGFLYDGILHRIGHLPNLINAVYMTWAGYSPAPFTNKTASDCQPALVEQKKRPRFPEPLKKTITDTRLMHNDCDLIVTELLERIVDTLEIDLAQLVFFDWRYS